MKKATWLFDTLDVAVHRRFMTLVEDIRTLQLQMWDLLYVQSTQLQKRIDTLQERMDMQEHTVNNSLEQAIDSVAALGG